MRCFLIACISRCKVLSHRKTLCATAFLFARRSDLTRLWTPDDRLWRREWIYLTRTKVNVRKHQLFRARRRRKRKSQRLTPIKSPDPGVHGGILWFSFCETGCCHKRQKPQAPIRNRQTRKVANAKGLNRNTNLSKPNLTQPNLT